MPLCHPPQGFQGMPGHPGPVGDRGPMGPVGPTVSTEDQKMYCMSRESQSFAIPYDIIYYK